MVRHRPTAILVIAILHIVGGAFGLFGSCYSIAIMSAAGVSTAPSPAPTPAPAPAGVTAPPTMPSTSQILKYFEDNVPGYKAFTLIGLGMSFVLDVMLLSAGIGLLKMQPWARTLSLIYAPVSIVFHVVSFVYQLVFLMPAAHELFASNSTLGTFGSIMALVIDVSLVIGFVVVVYPIVVLVLMLRRSTVAAFQGEKPTLVAEDAIEDDPWRMPPSSDATMR